jgi:DNA primase
MRIPESTLSEIQSRLDLAEVIGQYVQLQKKGSRYWGRCPFHQEKTPSFCVTPEKGVFYCFGCHKGGGLYQFVMEVEKVTFLDAVEILAKKAGVEIQHEEEPQGGIKRETFLELNRRLAASFQWLLTESSQAETAREYLAKRGMTGETIKAFQLGYAPADREWLKRFLLQKSYSEDFLARTGLFSGSMGGKSALFANRIVFPIVNPRGEVVAFGGRALIEGAPKYLNSPETSFFKKGENLFGIDKALPMVKETGNVILVEGYMDVLAMHQAGLANTVAPLGTALTESQVRLIKRYVSRVTLVFDADAAGEKATLRAVEMLEKQDVEVHVVELSGSKDPADIVKQDGAVEMKRQVGEAQPCFPYLVGKALRMGDRSASEGKERIRDFLFPFVAALGSQVRADDYIRILAEVIGVEEGAVRSDFAVWKRGPRTSGAARRVEADAGSMTSDLFLMLAVSANRKLFPLVRNSGISVEDIEDPKARELFIALEEAFRADETGFDALLARLEDVSLRETVARTAASGEFDVNQERIVGDGVKRIKERILKRKSVEIAAEMRRVEREPSSASRVRELLEEKMHLDGELAKLAGRASGDSAATRGDRYGGV